MLRERIVSLIDDCRTGMNSLRGPKFGYLFFWQEVLALAEDRLKKQWEKLQADGELPSDDDMRKLGEGDHIVKEDKRFTVTAKVSKPQERFDKDLFITEVARRYKLKVSDLEAIANSKLAKKETRPSLTKRVLEAS